MAQEKLQKAKGVLDPKRAAAKFNTRMFEPSRAMKPFVEHFWEVTWSLPEDAPFTQHNIPYPSVHFVFERQRSEVVGPISGRFTRVIRGRGRVFGAHFRPGMFRAFTQNDVAELTDQRRPGWEVLGASEDEHHAFERAVLGAPAEESADIFDTLLQDFVRDEKREQCLAVRDQVQMIMNDPELLRAATLAERAGISMRTLQRSFNQCVGLTPKFVIQRFRLQEAAERLHEFSDEEMDGATLAADLGFSDQAHFIRAFKNIVGATPEQYRKRNR